MKSFRILPFKRQYVNSLKVEEWGGGHQNCTVFYTFSEVVPIDFSGSALNLCTWELCFGKLAAEKHTAETQHLDLNNHL